MSRLHLSRLAPAIWLPLVAAFLIVVLGPLVAGRATAASRPAFPSQVGAAATGDLSVSKWSLASFFGAAAGQPISYTMYYSWSGDEPAPNVRVTDLLPSEVEYTSADPAPTTRSGAQVEWQLGTLSPHTFEVIVVTGTVRSDLTIGTRFTNTVTIAGDVTDEYPSNNRSEVAVTSQKAEPSLWLFKDGLLEELDSGAYLQAEQGAETTFDLSYFNLSSYPARDLVLVDELPAGLEYVSAEPAPSSVSGGRVSWQLNELGQWDFGQVKLTVRPTTTGRLTNQATISASPGVSETSSFSFDVVSLLPPRLLKPDATGGTADDPVILGSRPTFEGVAKAGGTVTLYEGSADGCSGDFSGCSPVPLGSAVAGPDRRWVITPTADLQTRDYALYLRVEKAGEASSPGFGSWSPFVIRIDPRFEQAGFDVDNFKIDSGDQEIRPGAIGGQSGTTPNQNLKIQMRQKAPDAIATDRSLWTHHDLQLVVTDSGGERVTETLPVSEVHAATSSSESPGVGAAEHFSSWDFIYVHKGFGPGSKVEIWCLPVFYTEDGIPIIGLVYVKCHEMVVDPAGYVYDRDKAGQDIPWPEKPADEFLIPNATVTATVRVGDNTFEKWDAAEFGQVNPQFTDLISQDRIQVNGYFAFYVPPGQYKLLATANGCAAFESPILTVVEEPVFYNVGMRCATSAAGTAQPGVFLPFLGRSAG